MSRSAESGGGRPEGGLPLGFGAPEVPEEAPVLSVSDLNRAVRGLLESAYPLVWVEGELSNFTHHRSGHMYFTLKDADAQVDAAMFRGANQRLTFAPADGQGVRALCQVTVYEPRGRYQVVVQALQPAGAGQLQQAFERLKARLRDEGLFDPARKRPLPVHPQRLGVVTAAGAAALRDVCSVLARRYPAVAVFLFPAPVQGEGAAAQIAAQIASANRFSERVAPLDALIVGRGGGSLEDLWAFNEEAVARAIAASRVPVVSAVGHEVDVTIADFVADVRAPTPSAAAELAVPDAGEVLQAVRAQVQRLTRGAVGRLREAGERLAWLKRSHGLRRPRQRLRDAVQRLDGLNAALGEGVLQRQRRAHQAHALLQARLEAANPAALLRRGYAVARDARGRVLRRRAQVAPGDVLELQFHDGRVRARAEEVDGG